MEKETKVDKLRKDLIRLRKKLIEVTMKKGLAAQNDKDLRENSDYEYWLNQEFIVMGRMKTVMELIYNLTKKEDDKPKWRKSKPTQRGKKHKQKWL